MSRKNLVIAAMLGAMLIPSLAGAGQHMTYPVYVSDSFFYGDFGSARNSEHLQESIGCDMYLSSARCFARNRYGVAKSCTTADSAHLEIIRNMGDSPLLVVNFNPSGVCTSIWTRNASYLATK